MLCYNIQKQTQFIKNAKIKGKSYFSCQNIQDNQLKKETFEAPPQLLSVRELSRFLFPLNLSENPQFYKILFVRQVQLHSTRAPKNNLYIKRLFFVRILHYVDKIIYLYLWVESSSYTSNMGGMWRTVCYDTQDIPIIIDISNKCTSI